jgi:hypothetical protein
METNVDKKVSKNNGTYFCECCDYICDRKSNFNKHMLTPKHQTATFLSQKVSKNNGKYFCECCDYVCDRKNNFNKHILTPKHQTAIFWSQKVAKIAKNEKIEKEDEYACDKCKKVYYSRGGIWKHKKTCSGSQEMIEMFNMMMESQEKKTTNTMKEVFIDLLKQNTDDFKELMKESYQAVTINQTNMNNCNNNNKFNLNFFLNDTCKDAMNIMDFVEMVKSELKPKDFEAYENGYSNTVSGLFLRGLKGLEVNQRPIHCSDLKREVLYVKDDNVWHLDSSQLLVTKAIKYISHYNFKQYPAWQKAHPACEDTNSKVHEHYMKLVRNCMSGGTDEEIENNYNKIIRNVMKEVVIDKKKTNNICE